LKIKIANSKEIKLKRYQNKVHNLVHKKHKYWNSLDNNSKRKDNNSKKHKSKKKQEEKAKKVKSQK
jgi:hypothetical protein